MKEKWNQVTKQLGESDNELSDFLDKGGLSTASLAKIKPFISKFNKFKKLIVEFDTYISPVDPLEISSPFKTPELAEMWIRWKEYLSEQHGQVMRTRSEMSAIEYLHEISGGDDAKAIKILRYVMTCRYKNFFLIEEKDVSQPAKDEVGKGSSFG